MKNKNSFLNFFFYPCKSGLIIIFLLLFNLITKAQETPVTGEFPIGATVGYLDRDNLFLHQVYDSTGMNLIEQDTPENPVSYLENYNVHAVNMDSSADYIYHYSSAYYSKWQAEQDTAIPYIGFKHISGQKAYWGDAWCWSTIDVTSPDDSLLFGPHYHQEKWYRRWLYNDTSNMNGIYDVRYIPRWRMALDTTDAHLDTDENVCRLSVWVRHAPLIYNSGNGQYEWDSTVHNHKLKESEILKVSDFSANGQFDYFYLSDNPPERMYKYPESYQSPGYYDKPKSPPEIPGKDTIWTDIYGENGVEFRVEWLRSDTKCTLYVDFIEVYDDYGWRRFIEDPGGTANNIKNYALNFKNAGWNNIKYWTGIDEPYTIDSYIPIRTVDSLLRAIDAPPLLVHVYAIWNVKINEDSMLARYYRTAKPDPLNIHFFPFNSWNVPASFGDWDAFRTQLQISYSLTKEKGFWYKVQNFGFQTLDGNSWLGYRQPDSLEHKAEIMLALGHGVKALLLTQFESYPNCDPFTGECYNSLGLVRLPPNYDYYKDPLYYLYTENIIPRLRGTLGTTLMNLNYTGHYIFTEHSIYSPTPRSATYDYLTLNPYQIDYFWHIGFLTNKNYQDDKYFQIVNLRTDGTRYPELVINNNTVFSNLKVRDVENHPMSIDTTITSSATLYPFIPAGEGYLYQVAPVVKYGGKLITDETIDAETTLLDTMIINEGVTLTVDDTYHVDRNITVYGDIVVTEDGVLHIIPGVHFTLYDGASITVEGRLVAVGSQSDRIIFDGDSWGSIIFDSSSSSSMTYADIKNGAGLQCLNGTEMVIDNCLIEDCTEAIYIYNSDPTITNTQIIDPVENGIYAHGYGHWVTIGDNIIRKNYGSPGYQSYQGLLLEYYVIEEIYHNDISGFHWGMYCGGGSISLFGELSNPYYNPNNRIDSCRYGIGVGWGANCFAGYHSNSAWCYSSISNNVSLDIYVYQNSGATAEDNYWGGGAARSSVDGTSTLSINPYLTEDPWEGESMKSGIGKEVLADGPLPENPRMGGGNSFAVLEGLVLEKQRRIDEAIDLYKGLVRDNEAVESALSGLLRVAKRYNRTELMQYLNQAIANFNYIDRASLLRLLANIKVQTGDLQGAMEAYDEIVALNRESYEVLNAKFSKLFIVINILNDVELATDILGDISSNSIEEEELIMKLELSEFLLAQLIRRGSHSNLQKKNELTELLPEEYQLYQNYPNPFNPATTIKYDLPDVSDVTLKIYDMLGAEVKTLVSQRQEPGRYEIQFNASSLASGVYIYQLIADKFISSKKMILLK